MTTILKISNLKKSFYRKHAINGINLEMEEGKVVGLLGPNGSGKTTVMKIIAGISKPTSGEVFICGEKPGVFTKSIVSYMPDINFLYKWMKIKDAIRYFADFYKDFDLEKSRKLLEFMKLNENDKITTLSKGMLEKVNLVLMLSRKAKLYVIDEPLGGIDISTREKIIDAIINNYCEGSSMLISTHLVTDIERIFDDVVFLSEGEIILQGNAEDLRTEKGKSITELYKEVFQ